MGQGNDAQADYGTPIRNSIVLMMSGPAVEIAALDSRIPGPGAGRSATEAVRLHLVFGSHRETRQQWRFRKFMKAAGP